MAERRKGVQNYEALTERKELGPYPCWDDWKRSLSRQLGYDNFDEILPGAGEYLHQKYRITVKSILGHDHDRAKELRKIEELIKGCNGFEANPKIQKGVEIIERLRRNAQLRRT